MAKTIKSFSGKGDRSDDSVIVYTAPANKCAVAEGIVLLRSGADLMIGNVKIFDPQETVQFHFRGDATLSILAFVTDDSIPSPSSYLKDGLNGAVSSPAIQVPSGLSLELNGRCEYRIIVIEEDET